MAEFKVGTKVQFDHVKRWWTVRAISGLKRYVILTRKEKGEDLYTILDFHRHVRGPDNMIFSLGYVTDSEIASRMSELVNGATMVSKRPSRTLDICITKTKEGK